MKNGINVAAVSELVHEIRNVPGEGEIHYGVALDWLGGLTMEIRTLPLTFGSKRLGRDFTFRVDHPSNPDPEAAPCPADFFMTGVGACVANILVQGASYKGITLDSLTVSAAAQLSPATLEQAAQQCLTAPQLEVVVKGNGNRWQYKQMMINVARFSPNYITATLANQITLEYQHKSPDVTGRLGQASTGHHSGPPARIQSEGQPLTLGAQLNWRNGTQFDGSLLPRQWLAESWSLPTRFVVDQPLPAAGLNEAPNPQEYLLAGVLSDVAQRLVQICQQQEVPLLSLSARMRCRLDMKGCFNLFNKAAVQLQDNHIELTASSQASEQDMHRYLDQAIASSVCWQSFVTACPISLERQA